MPSNWTPTTIGKVANVKHGFAFKSEFFRDEPTNDVLLTPGNFAVGGGFKGDKLKYYGGPVPEEYILQTGEILVTMTDLSKEADTLGYPALVPDDKHRRYLHNQRLGKVIVHDPIKVEPRFVYYLLCTNEYRHEVLAGATGTTVKHTSPGRIQTHQFLLPPPEEQRAIAEILAALDDKIELNRRLNETLETLALHLFKSSFTVVATDPMPAGWRYAKIAELCDINAWTLGKNDKLDRIEYVEISEVSRGNIASIQNYERGQEPSRARRRLRHGDTVLSTVRPDRGSYFLCLDPSPNFIASTGFAVLSPTKAPWTFVHAAMTQSEVFEYLGQHADGGAYPAVRPEIIGNMEVPWPENREIVDSFDSVCSALYERAELNRKESRKLVELRDTLLPKLLSGEIRVPIAAAQVKEAIG
jgi:type I restriction enzyme S subunit